MPPANHSFSPHPESFTKLRRAIVTGGAIAVLMTGIAVTLVALGPFYSTLARLQETHQLSLLTSRSAATEEYVFRLQEVGRQIASRTRAREKLQALNREEASLLEYQQFATPILSDALKGSQHVEGITRFDVKGEPVLGVGTRIPPALWSAPSSDSEPSRIVGPIDMEGRAHLLVRTEIVNRTGERVGTDLVLFRAERLRQIISDRTGLDESARLLFVDSQSDELSTGIVNGNEASRERDRMLITFGGELLSERGGQSEGFAYHEDRFVAFARVDGTSWAFLLCLATDTLYARPRGQIGWVLAVVLLLLLVGTPMSLPGLPKAWTGWW